MSEPSADRMNLEPAERPWWIGCAALAWLIVFTAFFYSFALPNNSHVHRLDIWSLIPDILETNTVALIDPEGRSGTAYLAQRIPLWGLAAGIFLSAVALGRLVLRACGLAVLWQVEQRRLWALCGGVGLSALSLITLVLGLAGLLWQGLFVATLLAIIGIEGWLTYRDRQSNRTPAKDADSPRDSLWASPYLWATLPFVLLMLLGAALPSVDFDVKEYHLQGPKEFYLAGRVQFLPHNVYTSFPFLTEMLTLCSMVVTGDWFAGAQVGKLVLMTFALITAGGLAEIAGLLFGPNARRFAPLLYLSTPWVYRFSTIALTEGAVACYVLLSVWSFCELFAMCRSTPLDLKQVRGWALVTGILAGSAVATKYTGLVSVAIPASVVWGVLILFPRWFKADELKTAVTLNQRGLLGLAFIGGGAIAFGPWLLKNLIETGNPVYPLLYDLFGGVDWNEQLNEKWKRGHSPPAHIFEGLLPYARDFRDRAIDVSAKSDWQNGLLFALAPLACLVRSPRQRRHAFWVWACVLYLFVTWQCLTHRIDRFWMPLLPLACLLAAAGLALLLSSTGLLVSFHDLPQRLANAAIIGWLGITLLYNYAFMTTPLCGYNAYLLDFRQARHDVTSTSSMGLLNEFPFPSGSRVLLVGEAQVFDAEFDLLYNTVFDFSLFETWCSAEPRSPQPADAPFLANEAIRANLGAAGVTHVFVSWDEVLRYRLTYGYTDFVAPWRFEELVQRGVLEPVPLRPDRSLALWSDVAEDRQQEVLKWGPSLRTEFEGYDVLKRYSLFRVLDEE